MLAIDIGNSNIVFGIFHNQDLQYTWRMETHSWVDISYYENGIVNQLLELNLPPKEISNSVISCVVPSMITPMLELLQFLTGKSPLTIQFDLYPDIKMQTENPLELGTDLFLNAVAAHAIYNRNNIIIDFGTALTFTVVEKSGNLLGVSIAPGLHTAIKALYKVTAQLPEVPLEWPQSSIGKNTEEAIQSGVLIGYLGLVKFHIEKIKEEFGNDFYPIITGGFSSIVKPLQMLYKDIDPMLTLKGMEIYSRHVFSRSMAK